MPHMPQPLQLAVQGHLCSIRLEKQEISAYAVAIAGWHLVPCHMLHVLLQVVQAHITGLLHTLGALTLDKDGV